MNETVPRKQCLLTFFSTQPTNARPIRVTMALAGLLICSNVSANPVWIERSWMTFDSFKAIGESVAGTTHVVEKGFGAAPQSIDLALPPGVPIAALAIDRGDVYFVAGTDWSNGGVRVSPRDVARIASDGTTTIVLRGAAAGIPNRTKIDALSVRGETLLFSLNTAALLANQHVTRSDVIAWNGSSFSIFLKAAPSVPPSVNLVALDQTATGSLLLGFDAGTEIAGIAAMPGDILERSPSGSWTRIRSREQIGFLCMPCDLQSMSFETSAVTVFRSGLEAFEQQ